MGRGVARRNPAHDTHKVKLYMHPCIKSVTPRVCLAKVSFLAFLGPDMKTKMIILILNIHGFMGLTPRFKCFR